MTDPTMDDASNAALAKTPSSRKTFAASMPVSWFITNNIWWVFVLLMPFSNGK
mgnify:CR=1 FL=1